MRKKTRNMWCPRSQMKKGFKKVEQRYSGAPSREMAYRINKRYYLFSLLFTKFSKGLKIINRNIPIKRAQEQNVTRSCSKSEWVDKACLKSQLPLKLINSPLPSLLLSSLRSHSSLLSPFSPIPSLTVRLSS